MSAESYPYQSSDRERQRLIAQAALVGPLTERLFEKAGLAAGMTALDIGSGSGDVALLAAKFVGRRGRVIGVDRDPAQIAFASERARAADLPQVEFRVGDFREIDLGEPVDAVVGRLVLMYAADPVDALRRAARHLRPGGGIG